MISQKWLTVLLSPPHTGKLFFPSVLWHHQPGRLSPSGLSEGLLAGLPWTSVPPQCPLSILPGPCYLKPIFLGRLGSSQDKPLLWDGAFHPAKPILLFLFLLPTDKKNSFSFLDSFSLVGRLGIFDFVEFFFVLCVFAKPSSTANFSPPDTTSHCIFMCILGCAPLFPCGVHVFLMYPVTSRHLHMLIISKADVLTYPCSRGNVHKRLWDNW